MREFNRRSYCVLWVCLVVLPLLGQAQQVPRKSQELVIQIPKGPQLLLSQFRGKVVALEFLFPLGIAFNDQASLLVPEFVRSYGVNYPVGFATPMAVNNYLDVSVLTRMVVPQIVLIDRSGMIRFQTSPGRGQEDLGGEAALRTRIEELLKESPGRKPSTSQRKKKS
ncbi:MAG: hypothetical protein NTY38_00765 [Acidobacteria bacterium]|nr:hypothetical protein [Acidobacteriota bacterium]